MYKNQRRENYYSSNQGNINAVIFFRVNARLILIFSINTNRGVRAYSQQGLIAADIFLDDTYCIN